MTGPIKLVAHEFGLPVVGVPKAYLICSKIIYRGRVLTSKMLSRLFVPSCFFLFGENLTIDALNYQNKICGP